MKTGAALELMLERKLVAVVRSEDSEPLVEVAKALYEGGIPVIEFTMTVPNALEVLSQTRRTLGDKVLLGAGTVLDAETARAAMLAGAEFVVSPTTSADVIRICRRYSKPVIPGAFTPTEILHAWESGADIVKVFPAEVVGSAFFKAVSRPLPHVRLMPTGGIDLQTAGEFLRAGACCLGVGGTLVDPKAIAARDFRSIAQRAAQFVEAVQKAP